ncbi:MAG: LPS export ABC transporter periplasmic protein LptC [Saccharospirillum sp.]
MPRRLQTTLWLVSLLVMAVALWWRPGQDNPPATAPLALPEDPPDLFIEQVRQTRFDVQGEGSATLQADSLAHYEALGSTRIVHPLLSQLQEGVIRQTIAADQALLFNNGDVEFVDEVIVQAQNTVQPWQLETDWLRLEQGGRFATTPSPVKLTQGNQQATGIGLNAWLAGENPELTLLSEVAIRYEMDAR